MYHDDHGIPHFHARYNEFKATFAIETSEQLNGEMPSRIVQFIVEWADLHKKELLENWELAIQNKSLKKISPLI